MEKLSLAFTPPQSDLKKAFDLCDKDSKGHLTRQELHVFSDYLLNCLKFDKCGVAEMVRDLESKGKDSQFPEVCESWQKQLLVQSTAELDFPAIKLVLLLKEMREVEDVDKYVKQDIDWCIEKVSLGKLYECELESASSGHKITSANYSKTKQKLMEMLPWLSQFSTPKITIEDIELYKNRKAHNEQRPKKHSVLLNDIIDEIKKNSELIDTLQTDAFNPFEFAKVFERKKILPMVAYHIFQAHDAFSVIDENMFEGFIQKIRSGYNAENLFHNDLHAADVLQMCHFMLTKGGIKEVLQLDKLDVASFLVACTIHDYKHPALTNGFMQNSMSELALVYNDQAILENFHIREAFNVIYKEEKCNIFEKKSPGEMKLIRKRIIGCVLSTDMARHFDVVNGLQNLITTHKIVKGSNSSKIVNKETSVSEFESKQLILNACIHAADVGNPARPFDIAKTWTQRVMEEFARQGDMEKKLKLPVSFLCDRNTTSTPTAQVGFISAIVKPLFEKIAQIFPGCNVFMENINKTEQEWRKVQAEAAAAAAAAKKQ